MGLATPDDSTTRIIFICTPEEGGEEIRVHLDTAPLYHLNESPRPVKIEKPTCKIGVKFGKNGSVKIPRRIDDGTQTESGHDVLIQIARGAFSNVKCMVFQAPRNFQQMSHGEVCEQGEFTVFWPSSNTDSSDIDDLPFEQIQYEGKKWRRATDAELTDGARGSLMP